MIYVRNLFTQDLRDGKQIAFPKEPSSLFFNFDFHFDDDRQIKFEFKDDSKTIFDGTVITTRLYKAGSEARIDGELKGFLKSSLNAQVEDIIVFRKKGKTHFVFDFINKKHDSYGFYKSILKSKNHEIIIEQQDEEEKSFLDEFIKWFIKLEGVTHNYLKNNFSNSVKKLKSDLLNYEEKYRNEFDLNVFTLDIENKEKFINVLETNINKDSGDFFDFSKKTSTHMPRAIFGKNNYIKFLKEDLELKDNIKQIDFDISSFQENCSLSGLTYSDELITRYISSLTTKPFVLLSGLSGSGKTKLAQAFAQWIAEDKNQYCIVPVGADWTNREPLLGYVNALNNEEYILPENGALTLLIEANKEKNKTKPYFLILDEMNLSHVERYFADFLSIMESKDQLKLHSDAEDKGIVTSHLNWPKNLFIVGTVNIDETTYMFSPKVLDRANVIEFRVNKDDISKFLDAPTEIDFTNLNGKGAGMSENFIEIASNKEFPKVKTDKLNEKLVLFFEELKKTGAEFGYRTATEIHRLYNQLTTLDNTMPEEAKIDIAIMQKLLPKLHGSRRKLCPILETLASFCVVEKTDVLKAFLNNKEAIDFKTNTSVLYPLSLEKITRMYKGAVDNGFASYAEA